LLGKEMKSDQQQSFSKWRALPIWLSSIEWGNIAVADQKPTGMFIQKSPRHYGAHVTVPQPHKNRTGRFPDMRLKPFYGCLAVTRPHNFQHLAVGRF
jgi:hypothetical protein